MPFRKVENCNQVVKIGKQLKFSLVNIAGNDIVQGNKKLILGKPVNFVICYADIINKDEFQHSLTIFNNFSCRVNVRFWKYSPQLMIFGFIFSLLVATDAMQHPSTIKKLKISLLWKGNH